MIDEGLKLRYYDDTTAGWDSPGLARKSDAQEFPFLPPPDPVSE